VKPFLLEATPAALFAIPLTDHIDSSNPILAESWPLGSEPKVSLYTSRNCIRADSDVRAHA
jgi:hypothetical protein